MKRKSLFILLLLISQTLYAQDSFDYAKAKQLAIQYNTDKTLNDLGLTKTRSSFWFIETFVYRTILTNTDTKKVFDALAFIHKNPRGFLKSVCYIDKRMLCYLGVKTRNGNYIDLGHILNLNTEDTLEFLVQIFDYYNDSVQDGNKGITNQVEQNFKAWFPEGGSDLLSLYKGNYINQIEVAHHYIMTTK